jgi:hypothetical protein
MAEPQDDYDQNEAMMNIINAGTQYGPNNQDEADRSSITALNTY